MIKLFVPVIYLTAVVYGTADIDCDDGGFYIRADPESKTHFYKCDNGEPVRFQCPGGLVYNQKSHVCDWPKNVSKSAKRTTSKSKPTSSVEQEYKDNNGRPVISTSDNNVSHNKHMSNNEAQYKPSNIEREKSKGTNTGTGPHSSSSTSGGGYDEPRHHQSSNTDEADIYAVQIIDNSLDLGGLGYTDSFKYNKRKA